MKLLHVTDIHYNKPIFQWIWQVRKQYDALCLTGDFLDPAFHQRDSLAAQIVWFKDWLSKLDIQTFICSGNHDVISDQENLPSIEELFANVDGDDIGIEGTEELSELEIAGTTNWMQTISNPYVVSDQEIKLFDGLKFGCAQYGTRYFKQFTDCDVLLTHVPPAHMPVSRQNRTDFGSRQLREAIEIGTLSPGYILSGHIHRPDKQLEKLKSTWVSNPGSGLNAGVPKHQDILIGYG